METRNGRKNRVRGGRRCCHPLPCIYTNTNVCIPYSAGSSHTFMTWVSPLRWAPSLRLHLLMNFHSVSLHVSLSHLSVTLWQCYQPRFPHSLNKQWAGGVGVGRVAVGWDRHWIITSSHSSQRKNDGEREKKGQNKNVTRHTEVLTLFPSCPHSHPKLMYTFPLTHGTLGIRIRALNGYPDCCIYLFGTPGEFLISLIV